MHTDNNNRQIQTRKSTPSGRAPGRGISKGDPRHTEDARRASPSQAGMSQLVQSEESAPAGRSSRRNFPKGGQWRTEGTQLPISSTASGSQVVGFRFGAGKASLVKMHRARLEKVIEDELARIEAEEQEALWAIAAAEIENDPYDWELAWAAASTSDVGKALEKYEATAQPTHTK